MERREHVGSAGDGSLLDALPQIFVNGFLGGSAIILARCLAPAEQTGVVQISMFRRVQTGEGRVIRSGPALPVVVQVTEHVKVFLPTGRARIERLAAGQFHAGDDKMHFMVPGVTVPYPQDIALVRLQARKGHLFKIVHDAPFLFRRYRVVRVPGKHPGGEAPFGVQRVDKGAGGVHIPA